MTTEQARAAGMDCFSFNFRCQIGEVVRHPMSDALLEPLPETPMLIVAEATRKDWEESVLRDGGTPNRYPNPYFYFISTD